MAAASNTKQQKKRHPLPLARVSPSLSATATARTAANKTGGNNNAGKETGVKNKFFPLTEHPPSRTPPPPLVYYHPLSNDLAKVELAGQSRSMYATPRHHHPLFVILVPCRYFSPFHPLLPLRAALLPARDPIRDSRRPVLSTYPAASLPPSTAARGVRTLDSRRGVFSGI